MRLIKMFGIAALAAVAAMAFVGATSASANTSTQLCLQHDTENPETGLLCAEGEAATSIHMVNQGVGVLLSDLVDVLCLNVLGEATPLGLGNPQEIHSLSLSFTGCGTNASHNNCTITVETLPLFSLLKTGLDQGSLTALNGQTRVQCDLPFPFPDIDCKYNATGLLFSVGAQHLTANDTPVTEIGSKALCPDNPTLDGLLKALLVELEDEEEHEIYILG